VDGSLQVNLFIYFSHNKAPTMKIEEGKPLLFKRGTTPSMREAFDMIFNNSFWNVIVVSFIYFIIIFKDNCK
jgi:hypothetical protein